MDFSQATKQERQRFADLLAKRSAQNCKFCGAEIVIEGCHSRGDSSDEGTEFSVMTVACNSCGEDVVVASSWAPGGHDDIDSFLSDLDDEWRRDAPRGAV